MLFFNSNYATSYITNFKDDYDVIGCELIRRGEMKFFDVLVRSGYLEVSNNMIHSSLVLNRNSIYKVLELATPETISFSIYEFLLCESVEMMIIKRYFSDEKYKEAMDEGIKMWKSEINTIV